MKAAARSSAWRRQTWGRSPRLPSRPPGVVLDVLAGTALAAFLAGLTPVTRVYQLESVPLDGLGAGLLVLTGLPLMVRRRWPRAAYLVGVGAAVSYLGLRYPGWPVYVGAVLALVAYLSAAGWAGWPLALAGGVVLGAVVGRSEGWQPVRMLAVFLAWLAIAAFTAQAAELRRRRGEELARHRLVEERLRIAREMHDVLSHSLATISVHSGTGLRLFKTRPHEAEAALRTIRQVSGEALAQARGALATIRDPLSDGPVGPGLGALDALLVSVRGTGLVLDASVDLGGGPVPAAVGAAAYRVVQESLTNVIRHAGSGARAAVEVSRGPDAIVVEVMDSGGDPAAVPVQPTAGHGVTGMRERVLALGGAFSAGPGPAGGFRVRARLPIGNDVS